MREDHCPTCTCGLTSVEWSDRSGWVDLLDPEDIANTVMNCALDHCYDRTRNGIPIGFPEGIEDALAPIVAKHLSAIEPDWKNKTVYIYDKPEARYNFQAELVAVATAFIKEHSDGN